MLYPWHNTNWKQLIEQWDKKPNAWLLVGKAKTGKGAFAEQLAGALLCESPVENHMPCGQCPSCHLLKERLHPDFKVLRPDNDDEESGSRKLQQIKIEAVRNIIEFTQLTSHRGGLRVVVVNPAETLNLQAANALLKVLEEPPENVIFILVSAQKDQLLPTIKSRCRPFVLSSPTHEEAINYLSQQKIDHADELLAFHGGSPLFEISIEQDEMRQWLLEMLSSPSLLSYLDFASKFDQKKWALSLFLDWMQKWIMDLIWVGENENAYFYPSQSESIKKMGQNVQPIRLFNYLNKLNQLAPYGQHTLNVKLQIESIFIDYLELIKPKQ